jgi:hypothetical protein
LAASLNLGCSSRQSDQQSVVVVHRRPQVSERQTAAHVRTVVAKTIVSPTVDEVTIERPKVDLRTVAAALEIEVTSADAIFPSKTYNGRIDGKAATPKQIDRYSGLFASELLIYPKNFVERAKLKRVVLCRDLSYAGQSRAAIPDFADDTLYLDVLLGNYDQRYQRAVIHHEFFHMIDFRMGRLYKDEQWAALNDPVFKYGAGGASVYANGPRNPYGTWRGEHPVSMPGFFNLYATTGVEEDKAELFANLIVDAETVDVRARTDRVLQAKVVAMKAQLIRFCPDMNDPFWLKAKSVDRRNDR